MTLSNNGTQELLVREAFIDLIAPDENDVLPVVVSSDLPRVLKPGEIALVTLPIPALFMQTAESNLRQMVLTFHVFTLKGKLRLAAKELNPFTANSIISDADWKPFILKKRRWWQGMRGTQKSWV